MQAGIGKRKRQMKKKKRKRKTNSVITIKFKTQKRFLMITFFYYINESYRNKKNFLQFFSHEIWLFGLKMLQYKREKQVCTNVTGMRRTYMSQNENTLCMINELELKMKMKSGSACVCVRVLTDKQEMDEWMNGWMHAWRVTDPSSLPPSLPPSLPLASSIQLSSLILEYMRK